jgi:hypothetical protein
MDIVNKSKALNILIPRLISKSNILTKEIKNRIKLNKIFSEFENKASNNFNYFITASNQRYTNSKLGNDIDTIISSTRAKNINEATKIVNDKFYKDANLEIEKQKMKYKSGEKIYNEIRDTFNKMRITLESKFSRNTQKEIDSIINGSDKISPLQRHSTIRWKMNTEKEIKPYIKPKSNIKLGAQSIKKEFDNDKITLDHAISQYLSEIQNECLEKTYKSSGNSPSSSAKKLPFKLPKIKLINYKQKNPPKKREITEEEKKPNLRKLLPYSNLGKHFYIEPDKDENSLNELSKKNFPFITETGISNNSNKKNEEQNYQNTLNVVYNSANKEFVLRNCFDKKRKKLELMLGINNIPELDIYDDILIKKSEKIKNKRHEKARKKNESQKMAILSKREKFNMIIDNDMELLEQFENKLYNKTKD